MSEANPGTNDAAKIERRLRPRLGVLASGGGSNLQAIMDAISRGDLAAELALVISNNSGAGALTRASDAGIPALHISAKHHGDPDEAICTALEEHKIDAVILAGYMKKIPTKMLQRFPQGVLNIHPGPLPRFGGKGMFGPRVHEAVLAAGVAYSGPTVHVVNEIYDDGPILAHRPVEVLRDDDSESLGARVLEAEHDLYWRVIRDYCCLDEAVS